eukprot:2019495-Prymnesium_polylepis.1
MSNFADWGRVRGSSQSSFSFRGLPLLLLPQRGLKCEDAFVRCSSIMRFGKRSRASLGAMSTRLVMYLFWYMRRCCMPYPTEAPRCGRTCLSVFGRK